MHSVSMQQILHNEIQDSKIWLELEKEDSIHKRDLNQILLVLCSFLYFLLVLESLLRTNFIAGPSVPATLSVLKMGSTL